jgi:hypothetical protein
MIPVEVAPTCLGLAWLPAATLRRLTALDDGVYRVVNPHGCGLALGHAGDHLALVQISGTTGHWATWTTSTGPVTVTTDPFCPEQLPDSGDGVSSYCCLPTGHDGAHDASVCSWR